MCERNRPELSPMVRTNWVALFNGSLSRVYFPVFVTGLKEESGSLRMMGEPSRGRTSKVKGVAVVWFGPPQLTVNGPHCVGGELDVVKTVAARDGKRASPRNNDKVRRGSREGIMSD